MKRIRLLAACAAMVLSGAAVGQIMECVDAKGKKEFAQSCPPGTVTETKRMNSGASTSSGGAAPGAKSLSEQDAAFRKRSLERQEAAAKAEKDKAEAKDGERNCNDARAQLKQLQNGERIARPDPKTGERSFLQDKDRPGEIAIAQKGVDSWCNKK